MIVQAYADQMNPTAACKVASIARHRTRWAESEDGLGFGPQGRTHRAQYKVAFLIHAVVMSQMLKNSERFKDVLLQAIQMVLPPVVREPFLHSVKSLSILNPTKGQLSRWRFLVDGSLCLYNRRRALAGNRGKMVRSLMADSSSQHGREFEHMIVLEVPVAELTRLLAAASDLVLLCRGSDIGIEGDETPEEHQKLMGYLRTHLVFRNLPLVVLGTGLTLRHKFRAVMHGLWLEMASSGQELQSAVSSFVSTTSDLGVEFALNTIAPVRVRELFPWMPCDVDEGSVEPTVSLERALSAPGLLHIMHTVAKNLLSVCPELDAVVDQMAAVCKLLRGRTTRNKLLEMCFGGPIGRQFHKQFYAFKGKVYRERWGTVAFAAQSLVLLMIPLRRFWSLDKYVGNDELTGAQQSINDALQSDRFWGLVITLDFLYALVRDGITWAESCPCHGDLDWSTISASTRRVWESCPLMGVQTGGSLFWRFHSDVPRYVRGFSCAPLSRATTADGSGDVSAHVRNWPGAHAFCLNIEDCIVP